jgi:glycosyltransferase involved in cell wall biosynthesis
MIGVQLILGDLPEPFLEAALRSVEWVDYVVVGPTAPPSEGMQENLKIVTSVVPHDKLRWAPYPVDDGLDFAAARNRALAGVPEGDYVLILDADEVHFEEWESIAQWYIVNGADSVTAAFYHFVCYRDAVQAIFPREILFRRYADTQFVGAVHEKLVTPRRNAATADYRYCHFSYLRPQPNVFERWRRYSVIEGEPHHYDGQSPDHIIDDRVSVATRFAIDYPPAAREVIEQFPACPVALQGEREPDPPKVGVVLLAKDDAGLLQRALPSLRETYGHLDVIAYDLDSTDGSQGVLVREQCCYATPSYGFSFGGVLDRDISLSAALNKGFSHFRDLGYDFIGWIHPDMRFDDPEWLQELLHELRCWPRIGKVCAANTRDMMPGEITDGHEQCYLIRAHVLNEIGLFDEGYMGIGGYEDWDMNRRILNAGHRVVITPRARVFHEGMATRSRCDTYTEQVANARYYKFKWGVADAPV